MKGWNLKMSLPNHLCLVKSWLRFACQLQLAKLCFQTESQLLINILCKWIWHSLEILAVSSNQDIRIYKIYCIFVIGIHVELRLFGYSDFSWNIQICNLRCVQCNYKFTDSDWSQFKSEGWDVEVIKHCNPCIDSMIEHEWELEYRAPTHSADSTIGP